MNSLIRTITLAIVLLASEPIKMSKTIKELCGGDASFLWRATKTDSLSNTKAIYILATPGCEYIPLRPGTDRLTRIRAIRAGKKETCHVLHSVFKNICPQGSYGRFNFQLDGFGLSSPQHPTDMTYLHNSLCKRENLEKEIQLLRYGRVGKIHKVRESIQHDGISNDFGHLPLIRWEIETFCSRSPEVATICDENLTHISLMYRSRGVLMTLLRAGWTLTNIHYDFVTCPLQSYVNAISTRSLYNPVGIRISLRDGRNILAACFDAANGQVKPIDEEIRPQINFKTQSFDVKVIQDVEVLGDNGQRKYVRKGSFGRSKEIRGDEMLVQFDDDTLFVPMEVLHIGFSHYTSHANKVLIEKNGLKASDHGTAGKAIYVTSLGQEVFPSKWALLRNNYWPFVTGNNEIRKISFDSKDKHGVYVVEKRSALSEVEIKLWIPSSKVNFGDAEEEGKWTQIPHGGTEVWALKVGECEFVALSDLGDVDFREVQ